LGWGLALLAVPRALLYGSVVEEDHRLRERLIAADQRLREAERAVLRVEVQESQLAAGQAGGPRRSRARPTRAAPIRRDARDWADSLLARAGSLVRLLRDAEPHWTTKALEEAWLLAMNDALPQRWPTDGAQSSGFGWRTSPLGGQWSFHSGLDLSDPSGAPIVAVASGEVLRAERYGGYGLAVILGHGFGVETLYGHCRQLLVKVGDRVEAGDLIARVGSTGRSTGPHLHFEVRLDGVPVDPLPYLPNREGTSEPR
jgi:murein DD-endopeptidase MepM/ murein hydrolase activator NlpD